jgi:hypothetical protein
MPFDPHHFEHQEAAPHTAQAEAVSLPADFELSDLEVSLPDDLQLLAEQLGEDALHLSALYPARAAHQWQATSLQVAAESLDEKRWSLLSLSQRWMKPVLVAAGLLVAVTVAWQSVPQNSPPKSPAVISTQAELKPSAPATSLESTQVPAIEDSLAYHPVVDQPTESSRIVGTIERQHAETEQEMVPTGLFITLSGPEQEAMLDLIEDAKLQQPSVSF